MTSLGNPIPPISQVKSDKLILRICKDVGDIFNITANHYINAGEEGLEHFNFLMNTFFFNFISFILIYYYTATSLEYYCYCWTEL